jgi:hypothetical protein
LGAVVIEQRRGQRRIKKKGVASWAPLKCEPLGAVLQFELNNRNIAPPLAERLGQNVSHQHHQHQHDRADGRADHDVTEGAAMSAQLDMFGSTVGSTSLTGLEVVLPRPCGCGAAIAAIGSSAGPHHARLKCAGCDGHRGWVSYETYQFLTGIIDEFGRPDQPVAVKFKDSRSSADNPL